MLVLRWGGTTGDQAAHVEGDGVFRDALFDRVDRDLRQIDAEEVGKATRGRGGRHRCAHRGRRRTHGLGTDGGRRERRGAGCREIVEVGSDDASTGAGAANGPKVDVALERKPLGERRRDDPAGMGDGRNGRSRCRGGWGRGSDCVRRSCGSWSR